MFRYDVTARDIIRRLGLESMIDSSFEAAGIIGVQITKINKYPLMVHIRPADQDNEILAFSLTVEGWEKIKGGKEK